MRKKTTVLTLLFFLFVTGVLSGQKVKVRVEDLAQKYQDWLKLVSYIILPIERDVFLQLTSERDRDIFIDTFWKQRDPTPGTPENEFKDEHIKRFNYASQMYHRGTTREGWQTDMGRIYIILGPPTSIERFEATQGLVPCQSWSYYGDVSRDMPVHFVLVFYQKGGVGEYRLYDPVADGPYQLLQQKRDIDPTDYETLYETMIDVAPTLADISLSIVPGEYVYPGYQPSPQNSIMLANILQSPLKQVSPSYATHFLDYKGIVSTEYLTNYVESDANISLIEDPVTGLEFIHFAVAPKSLSIDYYEPKDQYYCSFREDVSLRAGEDIIFQYNKDFPIYFAADQADRIRANGLAIEDSFPAIPGRFHLIILLQNAVGKEFTIYEKDIVVPGAEADRPRISGPFLGYKLDSYGSQVHIPYKVLDKKLVIDPKNTFGAQDQLAFLINVTGCSQDLWKTGQVKVKARGMRAAKPSQKAFALSLSNYPYGKIISISQSFPLSELTPDYYEIQFSLVDAKEAPLDEKTATFVVSAENIIPHPVAHAKGMPLSSGHLYHLMLARQYDLTKADKAAEAEYQKAFEAAPDFKEGLVDYANFLIKIKKFDKALEVNERLRGDEKFKYDYFFVRGRAQMSLGNYGAAIEALLEGNKIYNSDYRLLNALGYCYYRTGEKTRALETLRASLRLNPKQDDIKTLISEIEKK